MLKEFLKVFFFINLVKVNFNYLRLISKSTHSMYSWLNANSYPIFKECIKLCLFYIGSRHLQFYFSVKRLQSFAVLLKFQTTSVIDILYSIKRERIMIIWTIRKIVLHNRILSIQEDIHKCNLQPGRDILLHAYTVYCHIHLSLFHNVGLYNRMDTRIGSHPLNPVKMNLN